eukprot:TRINITY_DN6555_c0_g1_i1.p1 TRINITY_DN6555_c0_g1~~TRINITY_DN6555_c0_g1_i1.p1  ORF type:complete len:117 (-),score=26.35 TRINITY_DN6555_c0_g1_i1:122-472(-)
MVVADLIKLPGGQVRASAVRRVASEAKFAIRTATATPASTAFVASSGPAASPQWPAGVAARLTSGMQPLSSPAPGESAKTRKGEKKRKRRDASSSPDASASRRKKKRKKAIDDDDF